MFASPGADAVESVPNDVREIVGKRFGAYYQEAFDKLHGAVIMGANNKVQEINGDQIPFAAGTEIWNTHLGIDDALGGGSGRNEVPVDDFTDARNVTIKRALAEIIANMVTRQL